MAPCLRLSDFCQVDLDPPPARSPASKRRDRRHRQNGAAATEAATADTSKGRGDPAPGAATTTTSKRRNRRRKRRRNPAADRLNRQAPVVTDKTENTQNDAQGGIHDTAISKLESNKESVISRQGDSLQRAGCYLEAHLGDSLVQATSKQIVNSNDTRKRNFQRGNKEVQVSTEDPACPEVKNSNLAGNSEEFKEPENGSSLKSTSLRNEKKKRKKKRKGKKNNHLNTSTLQDPPWPTGTGTGTSCSMTLVAENNTAGLGLREKQNQNEIAMTNSFSVDNAKTTEVKYVNVDNTIEKKYGVVQPGLFEEKETENVAKLLGSCMLNSCKVTSTNVSFLPLHGVRVDANVKTNCVHSTADEKNFHSAVGEGFTKSFGVVSRTYSSEYNQNLGAAKHTREAIVHPSFISGVIENALTMLPSEDQRNQLDPFNNGASFFQIGYPASNGGSDVHRSINFYESDAMGNPEYELGRSYLDCTSAERNNLQEKEATFFSMDHNINRRSYSNLSQAYMEKLKITFSPRQSLTGFRKKKLLILDLNGLLADINQDYHNAHMADAKVRGKLVFRRPYCGDFLNFCIQNFELGIWSSRKRENVDSVVDILMRDLKPYILFSWDRSKCTFTGRKTLENMHKPLVLKELRKLWNKEEPGLPWEEGYFSPSNTLLVDDSPYKALRNPPHTAIFPHPYNYLNWNDNSLGPGGDLRVYLENLSVVDDVEYFVRNHPFGQPFITQSDPHWNFYAQIADVGYGSLTCRA